MDTLFAPEVWPFALAGMVMVAIAVIEGATLLIGFSASHWLDSLLPGGHELAGGLDGWLGWLHLGKVPALVLMVIFLAAFTLCGLVLNMAVHSAAGIFVPAPAAALVALAASVAAVHALGGRLARIIPQDQSFAVSLDTLVGRVATIVGGTARIGYPAEGRVADAHGHTLYVMVEPDAPELTFTRGDSVLLVKQLAGTRFQAIRNPRPDLL
ncbi:MAG TPA: OB-fold-containig protein [Stellaceae bacterium]|nr:OB-fold-containig protein [Stellaceae bacterium]